MLANMLILAHAVVPHHHHDKVFVAVVHVLDDEVHDVSHHKHSHHHDEDGDHHDGPSHHHDSDTEECLMSEAAAAAALKTHADGNNSPVEALHHTNDGKLLLLAAIGLYDFSFIPYYIGEARLWPYVTRGHTDYVACSKGLRAPPTC